MSTRLAAAREWFGSYWVTYVSMSRAERRRLIAILDEAQFPEDFVEIGSPSMPTDSNGLPLHNRKTVEGGPDICDECSYAAHDYVKWPCPPVAAQAQS